MKYWAFISYSHADKKWGDWLHHAMETFRVPRDLVGKAARAGVVPPRVFPIFRDREELPTSADLGNVIQSALEESRFLVVICSPRSAKSRWVNQEIVQYKRLGGEGRILALIVGGEPNASEAKPGVPVDQECFPEAIRYAAGADGQLDERRRIEPIAADARPDKDGKFNALLKLIAGVLGVNYDDLKRRDEARRRRRQRAIGSVAAALLLIFAALTGVALWQRQVAITQRHEADVQRQKAEQALAEARHALSESMLTEARQRLEKGDHHSAAVLFAEANALYPSVYARANAMALLNVLPRLSHIWPAAKPVGLPTFQVVTNPAAQTLSGISRIAFLEESWWMFDEPVPDRVIRHGSVLRALDLSADGGQLVTGGEEGFGRIWNAKTLQPTTRPLDCRGDGDAALNFVRFSPDGTRILTADSGGRLRLWNSQTGEALSSFRYEGCRSVVFSADSRTLIACSDQLKDIRFWEAATGRPSRAPMPQPGPAICLAASLETGKLVVGVEGQKLLILWDLAHTSVPKHQWKLDDDPYAVALDPVHSRAACVTGGSIELFSLSKETADRSLHVEHAPSQIGFAGHGKYLWAAGPGDQIAWWDADDGQPLARFGGGAAGEPFWVAPDATAVITGDNETSLLLHWTTPVLALPLVVPAPSPEQPAQLSDDGKLLAVATGMRVAVYDTGTGAKLCEPTLAEGGPPFALAFNGAPPALTVLHGIRGGIEVQAFDPIRGTGVAAHRVMGDFVRVNGWSDDLTRAVVAAKAAAPNSLTVVATEIEGKPLRLVFAGEPANGIGEAGVIIHTGQPTAWGFSSDGIRLAVATGSRAVSVFDTRTGKSVRDLGVQDRAVERVALSAHGEMIAFATTDLTVHVQDVATGASRRPPIRIPSDAEDFRFSSDGRRLVTRYRGGTCLADLVSAKVPVRRIPGSALLSAQAAVSTSVEFRGGGVTGFLLRRWDVDTGLEIGSAIPFPFTDEPKLLLFSALAGKAVLRQKDRLLVWPLDADRNSPVSPQELRRRAWVQTGLHGVEGNRVEQLSPSRWQALRDSQPGQ